MEPLTSKQQRVLSAIREFSTQKARMPTRQELASILGFKSVNSIQQYLSTLEKKGYIEIEKNRTRGMVLEDSGPSVVAVPLVGTVACGGPLLAEENIEAYIPVDKNIIRNAESSFFLSAHGDSMNEAGIDDEDLLLIEGRSTANAGDIVVALIGDEATVKIYKPNVDFVALVPKSSNLEHKPIILTKDFRIQGVVKKVIKKEQIKL